MENRLKNYLRYMEDKIGAIKIYLRAENESEIENKNGNENKNENGDGNGNGSGLGEEVCTEAERLMKDLLIQIGFFAHERLVHLIVTVTFAMLTIVAVVGFLISEQTELIALIVLLLVLLVPYIRHYYILENGVQKLYTFYDELQKIVNKGEKN